MKSKSIICMVLTLCMVLVSFPISSVLTRANEPKMAPVETETHEGTNANAQNYQVRSDTIKSYLVQRRTAV